MCTPLGIAAAFVGAPGAARRRRVAVAAIALTLGAVAFLDHHYADLLPIAHLYYLPILGAAITFGYLGGLAAAGAAVALYHLTHFVFVRTPVWLTEADLLRLMLFVAVALTAARRTLDDLTDTALVETGRIALHEEAVTAQALIEDCAAGFPELPAGRLWFGPVPEDAVVWGDRRRLGQVLINLVGNALKYSPEDTQVAVAVVVDADSLRFAVTDAGIGIAAPDLEHVFERYYRAADGRVRARRGTGLGLSISHDLVRVHGGELTASSAEGLGSTFTVRLPRYPGPGRLPTQVLSNPSAMPQPSFSAVRDTGPGGTIGVPPKETPWHR